MECHWWFGSRSRKLRGSNVEAAGCGEQGPGKAAFDCLVAQHTGVSEKQLELENTL